MVNDEITTSIQAVIAAALVITLGAIVYINVQKVVQDPFFFDENAGVIDVNTNNITTFTVDNIPIVNEDTTFAVKNGSNTSSTTTISTNCDTTPVAPCFNVTFATGQVTFNHTGSVVNDSVFISYRQDKQGFSNSGARDTIDNVGNNASSGFELGGVAILVMFAGVIILTLFGVMMARR